MNIARKIKEQTDNILRAQRLNGTSNVSIIGDDGGNDPDPGPGPVVGDWVKALKAHKASGDHDGRYYTKAQMDILLIPPPKYELLTNGDTVDPQLLFDPSGDILVREV